MSESPRPTDELSKLDMEITNQLFSAFMLLIGIRIVLTDLITYKLIQPNTFQRKSGHKVSRRMHHACFFSMTRSWIYLSKIIYVIAWNSPTGNYQTFEWSELFHKLKRRQQAPNIWGDDNMKYRLCNSGACYNFTLTLYYKSTLAILLHTISSAFIHKIKWRHKQYFMYFSKTARAHYVVIIHAWRDMFSMISSI